MPDRASDPKDRDEDIINTLHQGFGPAGARTGEVNPC
jgi:hypothetical protein